jgi:RND family efflux transporter MFP subunit
MNLPFKPAGTLTLALAVLLALSGCSSSAHEPKSAEKPPVAVDILKVEATALSEVLEVVGSLAPKFEAGLKSEFQGIVAEVYVTEWVRVKKGQPLARLDTREAQVLVTKAAAAAEAAKANQLQAEVALARSQREHQRLLKLKEVGLVTQQNLDDAATDEQASAARLAAAKAQYKIATDDLVHAKTRLDKAMVVAPMDGVVAYRGVSVGDMVGEAGNAKLMFKMADTRLLNLTVTVPSKDMRLVMVGQPLSFTTDAFPGRVFSGKVMFINPAVSETDRSVKVSAEVPNADETLKSGLFVRGRIVVAQREQVVQVPHQTLQTWDIKASQAEVFVVEGERAIMRKVRTGAVSGEMVEIAEGLAPDELVVVRGGLTLREGDRVKPAGGA